MKGYNSSAALLVILAALAGSSPAEASKTPEIQAVVPQDVRDAREALKIRLAKAAVSIGEKPRDGAIAQWYNSRFSNQGFSNW